MIDEFWAGVLKRLRYRRDGPAVGALESKGSDGLRLVDCCESVGFYSGTPEVNAVVEEKSLIDLSSDLSPVQLVKLSLSINFNLNFNFTIFNLQNFNKKEIKI